jgi:hypothetical protein
MDERHDIEGTPATNGAASENGSMPVLAGSEAQAVERAQPAALPTPVVAAAGGAVVGAFAVMLLRVLRRPARPRGAVRVGRWGRGHGSLEVTASRSFLVDVHMLKR